MTFRVASPPPSPPPRVPAPKPRRYPTAAPGGPPRQNPRAAPEPPPPTHPATPPIVAPRLTRPRLNTSGTTECKTQPPGSPRGSNGYIGCLCSSVCIRFLIPFYEERVRAVFRKQVHFSSRFSAPRCFLGAEAADFGFPASEVVFRHVFREILQAGYTDAATRWAADDAIRKRAPE